MKKIGTKPCPFCGAAIIGRKRTDRNSYHYAPRCVDCAYKALTPEVLATRRRVLKQVRVQLPVGSKRLHTASDGFIYTQIKVAEPNQWAYEHRVVTNAQKGTHVHHKNGDTLDNSLENLALVSPKEHRVEHAITQWARKFTSCIGCKTTEKRHLSHGLCTTCYQRAYPPKK